MITVEPADVPSQLALVRELFCEYADGLSFDLGFQDFAGELAGLPGKYAAPSGRLLLAWRQDQLLGCIALRPIDDRRCEMKRLYVRPAARGHQLGRLLVERLCLEAVLAGYTTMCLDTLPSMASAVRLYLGMGFKPVNAYVYNPMPGVMFLGRDLADVAPSDLAT